MKTIANLFCLTLLGLNLSAQTALLSPGNPIYGGQIVGDTIFQEGIIGSTDSVNNWPSSEPPANAIDGVSAKYLNFGIFNTGLIVTPGESIVSQLQIWTANDFVKRDPFNFVLYGTNSSYNGGSISLTEFTKIASDTLNLPSSRNSSGTLEDQNSVTISVTDTATYESYLIYFPTVKQVDVNPPLFNENAMQIAELQLFGTKQNVEPLPMMSHWRLLFLGIITLITGTVLFMKRRKSALEISPAA